MTITFYMQCVLSYHYISDKVCTSLSCHVAAIEFCNSDRDSGMELEYYGNCK